MRWKILLILILVIPTTLLGQDNFIGTVLNGENNQPIPNASIKFGDSGVITDASGKFVIPNPTYPLFFEISHLNFHKNEIIIRSPIESNIVVRLIPKTTLIDEIQVIGERIKRYYPKQYYYIVDYFIYNDMILTIGYKNSRLSKGQVVLTNYNQDTLAYLPLNKPKKIFQDGFGNIHIFGGDTVYQVYIQDSNLFLLYPTFVDDFSKDLLKFQFNLGNKFVFREISGQGQANEYYAIDTITRKRIDLDVIYQEKLFSAEDAAIRYKKWNPRLRGKVSESPGAANDMFEEYVFDNFIIHNQVLSQIFKFSKNLILFDHSNNRITVYNENLDKVHQVKSKFPKHHQRIKLVIQDSVTKKFYWVYFNNTKVTLGEIDLESGQIIASLETPSLPFIENIKIINGVIWFLYQPRLGETVRSLYRME